MPEETLQEQYEAMKAKVLKKDGTTRAGVTPEQVEALEELRIQACDESDLSDLYPGEDRAELDPEDVLGLPVGFKATENGLEVPDGARLECSDVMHDIAINVNGRARTRRVPTR